MLEGLDAQSFEPFEHEVIDRSEQSKVGHEKENGGFGGFCG